MKTTLMQLGRKFTVIIFVAVVWGQRICSFAQSNPHPLAPPDRSSPRATLTNFLALMDTAYSHWKSEGRTYEHRVQRAEIGRLAHQFFDLNDIAPSIRKNVGREAAVYLKEVLDRIELPSWDKIPNEATISARAGELDQWTIPQTEITLVKRVDSLVIHAGG